MSPVTEGTTATRGTALTATALLVVALAGCAGGPASNEAELHQDRTSRDSANDSAAASLQGKRLTEQAEAQGAASSAVASVGAADAQGARLAEYAERLAATGGEFVAPDRSTWAEHRGIED